MVEDDDPTAIRSIALSPGDAASAYAYTQENPGEAVLRVTPPFHGRMRARIHVYRDDDAHVTGSVHVPPGAVIADDVVDEYPSLEANLEDADPSETEQVRKRHADAVEEWQDRARESIVDAVSLALENGSHRVEIKRVG